LRHTLTYFRYVWYQLRSHHDFVLGILKEDDEKDEDKRRDLHKAKLTLTESIIALLIALACVSLIAVLLVEEIHYIVEERGVTEAGIGLILVPVVEKAAGE
jgi:Ca2+:H+ antiporter